jgi:glutamyl-tRNA synthetase
MGITHVIRGADLMGNTPIQLALYDAFGAAPPIFAHLPLIVGESGRKLSKRRGPVSVQQFRDEGYLPEAMLNWLARLGWSHGDDEIFTRNDIALRFDLSAVGRASAQADPQKLSWLNQHWIKALPLEALWPALAPHLERVAGRPPERSPALDRLVDLLRERSHTLVEMAERARWLLVEKIELDERAARKHLTAAALPLLEALRKALAAAPGWAERAIEEAFEGVRGARGGVAMGRLAQPVRVAVTGSDASPGIYETLAVLGRERSLARIDGAIGWIRAHAGA